MGTQTLDTTQARKPTGVKKRKVSETDIALSIVEISAGRSRISSRAS
jgi:hypothetical protein